MPIILFVLLKIADMEGKYLQNTWLMTKEYIAFKKTVGFTKPNGLRSLGAIPIKLDVRGGGRVTTQEN